MTKSTIQKKIPSTQNPRQKTSDEVYQSEASAAEVKLVALKEFILKEAAHLRKEGRYVANVRTLALAMRSSADKMEIYVENM